MKHGQLFRLLILVILIALCWIIAPGCANQTPDQITANANAIASVVTTTGQVVTPLIVNYENGKSVKVAKPKHAPKPSPTPK